MNSRSSELFRKRHFNKFFGVYVNSIEPRSLMDWILESSSSLKGQILAGHNLHSVYLYYTDDVFRRFYEREGIILCDGFPVALTTKGNKRFHPAAKIGSTDWIPLMAHQNTDLRLAVIGATKASNADFTQWLRDKANNFEISGWDGENWNEAKMLHVSRQVLAYNPNVTLIALGMPIQEKLAAHLLDGGLGGVVATVGGAVDQLSGHQKTAPRVLSKFGIEWLWRLISQPNRLANRYLVEPWSLARILFTNKFGLFSRDDKTKR